MLALSLLNGYREYLAWVWYLKVKDLKYVSELDFKTSLGILYLLKRVNYRYSPTNFNTNLTALLDAKRLLENIGMEPLFELFDTLSTNNVASSLIYEQLNVIMSRKLVTTIEDIESLTTQIVKHVSFENYHHKYELKRLVVTLYGIITTCNGTGIYLLLPVIYDIHKKYKIFQENKR